jgi:hypothetical protein
MSEMTTPISSTAKITRAELAMVPTSPVKATHIPIPHEVPVEILVGIPTLSLCSARSGGPASNCGTWTWIPLSKCRLCRAIQLLFGTFVVSTMICEFH